MSWFKKEKSFDQAYAEYESRMKESKFGPTLDQFAKESDQMQNEFRELALDTPVVYDAKFHFLWTEILKLRERIK